MIEKNYTPLMGVTRVVLAIAMAGSCAFAQSASTPATEVEETELPAITVSASSGSAIAIEDVGVSVTVLNVEDLKEEGIYNLGSALLEAPGVFALPGGGSNQQGNTNKIVIRGMSSSAHTLSTMDGMRIYNNNAYLTENIAAQSNLFNIGTLEVLRGSQAAVYGGGAIGGVIYMETPEGQGEPSCTLFNEYGSFDSYTGSMTAQGQVDKLSYFVNLTYMTTNNDLQKADGSSYGVKHLGHSESWQESLRLDYTQNEDNKTTFTYRRQDNDFRYIGYYTPYCDYNMSNQLITAKHQTKINEIYSTSLMAGYYGTDNNFDGGYTEELRNVQIQWDNAMTWNKQNTTNAGFAWNRSSYMNSYASSTDLENTYGFFADHNYSPIKNWNNNLALRLDNSTIYGNHFTYRAASSYKFNEDNTRAFASFGSGYKSPTQNQTVDGYDAWGYKGDPDLDVEKSLSFDLGLEQKIAQNHKVSATYFWIQRDNAITAVGDYMNGYEWVNSGERWLSQGLELSLTGIIEQDWNTSYQLSYTYTQPKAADDEAIPATARQLWSADIHTSPVENLTLGLGLTAATQRVDYNGNNLDSYYSLRLYANYKMNEDLSFHIRVENLTNQKFTIEPAYAYDQYWNSVTDPSNDMISAGTAVYAGCTITF